MSPQSQSMVQDEPLEPSTTVKIQRLIWDWNDPSEAVEKHLEMLGSDILKGYWYINPVCCVFSPEKSREFFSIVHARQNEWFRVLNRELRSANWKRKMNVTKTDYERWSTFRGLLIIHGRMIDSLAQWKMEADFGLHPESDLVFDDRPEARASVKEQDWESLKTMCRTELELQLSLNPMDPIYVMPEMSVMGLKAHRVFYAEVEKRSNQWHRFLTRTLGNRGMKSLVRDSDWVTRMLVFHGTLVIEGKFYFPGCWPNQQPTEKKLAKAPFGSATVPPDSLGLQLKIEQSQ